MIAQSLVNPTKAASPLSASHRGGRDAAARRRDSDRGAAARGRRFGLRLSGRRGAAHLRRAVALPRAHHALPRPPRAGRGAHGRGLRALFGQGRRGARHVGAGRDQRRHRHRQRLHGLDAHRRHHGPGAAPAHRHRRVSGGGHGRHHPALREAQLSGARRARPRGRGARGVLPRALGAARPRRHRHPEGRVGGALLLLAARPHRLPVRREEGRAGRAGHQPRGGRDSRIRAPGALRRRRHRQLGRERGAARVRRRAATARHADADGTRRLPLGAPALPQHAGDARHVRRQHGGRRERPA